MVFLKKMDLEEYEIIDAHTHIFPELLAHKASENIGTYYGLEYFGDGTLETLLSGAKDLNVSHFVVSSAATNPKKVSPINVFLDSFRKNCEKLVCLGALHPYSETVKDEIKQIKELALSGIKIHPDFQNIAIDDEKMFPIYEEFSSKIPILFHVGDPKSDLSSPERLRKVIDNFPSLIVIAAHMGGYSTYELALEYLVGKNVYFDTSNAQRYIASDELVRTIRRHGVEKILFGSDYPLMLTADAAKQFYELNLEHEEFELIFSENAKRLFKI